MILNSTFFVCEPTNKLLKKELSDWSVKLLTNQGACSKSRLNSFKMEVHGCIFGQVGMKKCAENKLYPFTQKTWTSLCEFIEKWINLDGEDKLIASAIKEKQVVDFDSLIYHRSCYQRFTNKRRIDLAIARKEKGTQINLQAQHETVSDHSEGSPVKKLLRSKSGARVRELLNGTKGVGTWPPRAENVTVDACKQVVPAVLFNFLAWCTGMSMEVSMEDAYVSVDQDQELKLMSVAQDLIHLESQGRKVTPKHAALGMTVRHMTGSSQLLGVLNGLGHCMSHSFILEHDTALAEQELRGSGIPPGFASEVFTTLVWDNNDFGEETKTGKSCILD